MGDRRVLQRQPEVLGGAERHRTARFHAACVGTPVLRRVTSARRSGVSRAELELLDAYWRERKYHHTIAATLVYALAEALSEIEDEGLEERWERHRRHHESFASDLAGLGLTLLPPKSEQLWTLHTVVVPQGVSHEQRIGDVARDGLG